MVHTWAEAGTWGEPGLEKWDPFSKTKTLNNNKKLVDCKKKHVNIHFIL